MTRSQHSSLAQTNSRAADPRPARTRLMILDAIERLGVQQREITVASVVHEAQLSRSSFYSQFSDLGDVAVQLIRETRQRAAVALDLESPLSAPQIAVQELVSEFESRRALYAAVFGAGCTMQTLQEIYEILTQWVKFDIVRAAPDGLSVRHAPIYIAAGVFAILTDWVLDEFPGSAAHIKVEILGLLPVWLKSESLTPTSS